VAVVRDLADPEVEGSRRRWAGWLLQLEDEQGQFFRKPIGHPALEIVVPDLYAEEPRSKKSAVTAGLLGSSHCRLMFQPPRTLPDHLMVEGLKLPTEVFPYQQTWQDTVVDALQ